MSATVHSRRPLAILAGLTVLAGLLLGMLALHGSGTHHAAPRSAALAGAPATGMPAAAHAAAALPAPPGPATSLHAEDPGPSERDCTMAAAICALLLTLLAAVLRLRRRPVLLFPRRHPAVSPRRITAPQRSAPTPCLHLLSISRT